MGGQALSFACMAWTLDWVVSLDLNPGSVTSHETLGKLLLCLSFLLYKMKIRIVPFQRDSTRTE